MVKPPETTDEFNSLVQVIEALRGPQGCPWDLEQTHDSLVRYAIEEVFEYVEAVDKKDSDQMKEELGDILLQVVLNSVVAKQDKQFELKDVIQSITEKMIRRHPHVFSDDGAKTSDEVTKNWEQIKQSEKKSSDDFGFNLPPQLPSLHTSVKIGEKTKKVGFDWDSPAEVFEKVLEELNELKEVNSIEETESELGDLLFSLAQFARHKGIDPDQALRKTNLRFEKRYVFMQKKLAEKGQTLKDITMDEKEALWKQAKSNT